VVDLTKKRNASQIEEKSLSSTAQAIVYDPIAAEGNRMARVPLRESIISLDQEAYDDIAELQSEMDAVESGLAAAQSDIITLNGKTFEYLSVVKTAGDLSGTLSSNVVYAVDGVIDLTGTGVSIEVPLGGLSIVGFSLDNFGLICNDDSYTMFTSPVGGSGNVFLQDLYVTTDGSGSQVFDLVSVDGNSAIEFNKVNFVGCTNRGEIDGYRQGLEVGCGMFGSTPSLTLTGAWSGGYRISTTNVFGISDAMTDPLFKAGPGFSMQNRFFSDINADLGSTAAFFDFTPAMFPNDNTVQLNGAQLQRNGVFDPSDTTITPNMDQTNLCSKWEGCVGIRNTSQGGKLSVSSSSATSIASSGTFYDLAGTWAASNLDHFSSPANGQIRHDTSSPQEYSANYNIDLIGGNGDEVTIKLVKWDESASSFVDVASQTEVIENRVLTADRVFFVNVVPVDLDDGDYLKLQVANLSDTTNVTADTESFLFLSKR